MASQSIVVKLLTAGINVGNFTLNEWVSGNTMATGVSRGDLLNGVTYYVDTSSTYVTVKSNTLLSNNSITLYIPNAVTTTSTTTTTTTNAF